MSNPDKKWKPLAEKDLGMFIGWVRNGDVPVEVEDMVEEIRNWRGLVERLLDRIDRCESNRGAFSCVEYHDSRCPRDRKIKGDCECGRDELDAATIEARAKLVESKQ